MDTARFAREIEGVFAGDVSDGVPVDSRFGDIAALVQGFTTPAQLATLSLGVSCLGPDECYLEVGSFQGRSLRGASLDASGRHLVAVESFTEFGMDGSAARQALHESIDAIPEDVRVELLDADFFRIASEPGRLPAPIGLFFYDGEHTRLAQRLALAVVEELLADEALVLVDDANWPDVRRPTLEHVARNPGWSVLRSFDAARDDDPAWANGLLILRFQRKRPSRISRYDRLGLTWQHRVHTPLAAFAWRASHRLPVLRAVGKRALAGKGRRVA